MFFANMDALFHVASQGDSNAYNKLRESFIIKGKAIFIKVVNRIAKNSGITLDFNDFLDDLFVKVLTDYDSEKCSFSGFVKTVLEYKISNCVFSMLEDRKLFVYSLDDVTDSGTPYIELVEDEHEQNNSSRVVVENFKLQMASPKRSESKQKRLSNEITILRYAGFSDTEICKHLNISIGVLRYATKLQNKDLELINLKLELK